MTVAGGLVGKARDVASVPFLLAFVLFPQRRRDPYAQYKLLRDMAAKGQSFYGKPAAKAA